MKNVKKILALMLCAVLLIGASVAGTLAYLTSQDEVQNTFTVGNVTIELHEEGEKTIDDETVGLDLHLLPGIPVAKEPIVTVKKDSEDCYVRVKVTVDVSESWTNDEDAINVGMINNNETFKNWADNFANGYLLHDKTSSSEKGFNIDNWNLSKTEVSDTAKTITYILTYIKNTDNIVTKDTENNTVLEAIFNDVNVPTGLTNDQLALLEGMKIKVEAHAIQAEGFDDTEGKTAEQNAWDAFDSQNN